MHHVLMHVLFYIHSLHTMFGPSGNVLSSKQGILKNLKLFVNILKIIRFHLKSWYLLLLLKKIRKPVNADSLSTWKQLALEGPSLLQPSPSPIHLHECLSLWALESVTSGLNGVFSQVFQHAQSHERVIKMCAHSQTLIFKAERYISLQ